MRLNGLQLRRNGLPTVLYPDAGINGNSIVLLQLGLNS
jgi:hypothetical protein